MLERVSYYLTEDTVFNITYAGFEYRMFTKQEEEALYYVWTPYWSFIAENPNDNKIYSISVDLESGMVYSYQM